jgi:hypothetical protein
MRHEELKLDRSQIGFSLAADSTYTKFRCRCLLSRRLSVESKATLPDERQQVSLVCPIHENAEEQDHNDQKCENQRTSGQQRGFRGPVDLSSRSVDSTMKHTRHGSYLLRQRQPGISIFILRQIEG